MYAPCKQQNTLLLTLLCQNGKINFFIIAFAPVFKLHLSAYKFWENYVKIRFPELKITFLYTGYRYGRD